jgi:peptidoglycan/LPS O-acetylase OafA/YrhL
MVERPVLARIIPLDGLRGCAIALVLLHHYVQLKLPLRSTGWPPLVDRVLTLSWSGVDLFFVLSGFLIGGLLIDHRDSPRLARVFYLRRALRILPLYFATLLVLFGWLHVGRYARVPAWSYFTFTSNHGMAWLGAWDIDVLAVMWSLSVEEQFYLVAPWVIRWIRPVTLPRILLSMIAVAWVCRIAARFHDPSGITSYVLMPCRMDDFAFGILAAWAVRSTSARAWTANHLPHLRWPLLLATLPLLVLTFLQVQTEGWQLPLYGYTCLGLWYASVLYTVVARQPAGLVAILSWVPLVSLGRLSYFIYLWHTLVLASVARRILGGVNFTLASPGTVGVLAVALAATWGLAWISWRIFEGPLIRLGQRHAY